MFARYLCFSLLALAACCGVACKTVNPATGQSEFDPAKTEATKAAIEPVITSAIRRVLANNPRQAAEIAGYFRAAGQIFCRMDAEGKFDPAFLTDQLDPIVSPQIGNDLDYLLTIKDALIALYKIHYAQRLTAELPPDAWARHLANLFCTSINRGLTSAGQPGL